MRIRVVFVVRRLERGGAERQLVELLRRLPASVFDLTLVTFYDGGDLAMDLTAHPGVRVISLCKAGRWDIVGFTVRAVRVVRQARPAIVHGWLGMANLLSLLLGRVSGARVVWGVRSGHMALEHYDWLTRFEYGLTKRLARWTDLVVFNSWEGQRYHQANGYGSVPSRVIVNGTDVDRFRPDPVARQQVRTAWGMPQDVPLVGLVARLDPIKDHQTFLRAAALVVARNPTVRFVCVGDGPQALVQALRDEAVAHGLERHVRWEPERSDVEAVHAACDLIVLSSRGEGFPNVLLEALSSGTRCVSTAAGDAPTIVEDPACITPVGDAAALADAILGALERRTDGHGDKLRQRVVDQFSAARMASDYERLLVAVATSARGEVIAHAE